MAAPLLVCDFDGFIADSRLVMEEVLRELGERHLGTRVRVADIKRWKKMPLREVLVEVRIGWRQLVRMTREGRALVAARLGEVEPVAGMPEVLRALAQEYRLAILSSGDRGAIEAWLERHKLRGLFTGPVVGGAGLFGKHWKLRAMVWKRWLARRAVVMLGDEARDVEAGKRAGVWTVAGCWGHSDRALLVAAGPDVLVDEPGELVLAVRGLVG